MARVKMDSKAVENFKKKAPVAKGKKRKQEHEHDHELEGKLSEHQGKSKKRAPEFGANAGIPGNELRGVMDETMARVYSEIWPTMVTHEGSDDDVHYEIREESYILSLAMIAGRDEYQPRRGLRIREAEIADTIGFCADHN